MSTVLDIEISEDVFMNVCHTVLVTPNSYVVTCIVDDYSRSECGRVYVISSLLFKGEWHILCRELTENATNKEELRIAEEVTSDMLQLIADLEAEKDYI